MIGLWDVALAAAQLGPPGSENGGSLCLTFEVLVKKQSTISDCLRNCDHEQDTHDRQAQAVPRRGRRGAAIAISPRPSEPVSHWHVQATVISLPPALWETVQIVSSSAPTRLLPCSLIRINWRSESPSTGAPVSADEAFIATDGGHAAP